MKGEINGVNCDRCFVNTTSLWRRHPVTQAYLCNICGLKAYEEEGNAATRKRKRAPKKRKKRLNRKKATMQLPAVSSRDNFQVYLDQVLENRIKRTGSAMDKAKETKLQSPFRDVTNTHSSNAISGQETLLGGKSFSLDEMFSIKPDPTLADSQSDSFPSLTYEVDEQCPKTATLNENLEMGKDQFGFNQDFQAEDYDLFDINDFNIVQPHKFDDYTW